MALARRSDVPLDQVRGTRGARSATVVRGVFPYRAPEMLTSPVWISALHRSIADTNAEPLEKASPMSGLRPAVAATSGYRGCPCRSSRMHVLLLLMLGSIA